MPYRLKTTADTAVVLVDDVVTTGSTLEMAIAAIGPGRVALAVAANAAPLVSSLIDPSPRA